MLNKRFIEHAVVSVISHYITCRWAPRRGTGAGGEDDAAGEDTRPAVRAGDAVPAADCSRRAPAAPPPADGNAPGGSSATALLVPLAAASRSPEARIRSSSRHEVAVSNLWAAAPPPARGPSCAACAAKRPLSVDAAPLLPAPPAN